MTGRGAGGPASGFLSFHSPHEVSALMGWYESQINGPKDRLRKRNLICKPHVERKSKKKDASKQYISKETGTRCLLKIERFNQPSGIPPYEVFWVVGTPPATYFMSHTYDICGSWSEGSHVSSYLGGVIWAEKGKLLPIFFSLFPPPKVKMTIICDNDKIVWNV